MRPQQGGFQYLVVEMLVLEGNDSPAAGVPSRAHAGAALQVTVRGYQSEDVLQDLIRQALYRDSWGVLFDDWYIFLMFVLILI